MLTSKKGWFVMKKTFKKLTALLFVFVLIFSFAGCESDTGLVSEESEYTETVETLHRDENSEKLTVDDESTDIDTSTTTSTAEKEIGKEPTEEKTATTKKPPVKTEDTAFNTESTQKSSVTTSSKETNKKTEVTQSKENTESETITSSSTDNTTTSAPTVTIPTFTKSVNVYEHKNIETATGSDDYYAWLSVYCINDNASNNNDFQNEFKNIFGYVPTAKVQSKYIGEFLVDGYEGVQKIYQYTIEDSTYPLIIDEFYVVKKKICADGSGWCGFPIPCSMDNMDNSQRVQNLLLDMREMFCEWYGVDYSYVTSNRDKFMVNMISEAGLMRTEDGRVLNVIYRYIRGINMPI